MFYLPAWMCAVCMHGCALHVFALCVCIDLYHKHGCALYAWMCTACMNVHCMCAWMCITCMGVHCMHGFSPHAWVSTVCMYVHCVHAGAHGGQNRIFCPLDGIGIMEGHDPSCRCWEQILDPLGETALLSCQNIRPGLPVDCIFNC